MSAPEPPKYLEDPSERERATLADGKQVHEDNALADGKFHRRQSVRWSIAIGAIALILLGAGFGWRWWQTSRAGNAQQGPAAGAGQPQRIPVKVAAVQTQTVQEASVLLGTLEDRRSAALKPEIEGRVSQILVKEGDRVKQGQVVIRLDSDAAGAQVMQSKAGLNRAQARLAELQAGTRPEEIAQAEARLNEAQARLTNARAGARPEEIAQAQAQIQAARADLELARDRLNRYRGLRQQGVISEDELDEYITEERSAAARLQEAERRLAEVSKSRSSDIDQLAATVERERQALRQLQNGPRQEEIAQARSQVAEAAALVRSNEVRLDDTVVRAPFAGKIGDIPVKVGDYVSQGDTLTTIADNDSLELNLSIPLEQASRLRLGLPVEMLDPQGNPLETGKVSFISPEVNPSSQGVLVKATFSNSSGKLLNLQFARARVVWNERPGLLVPTSAVSRLGGQTFVFVAENQGQSAIARQKPVKLGEIQGNNYQVIEGLKPGEKIIVSGILNLSDGAPIIPES